MAHIRRRQENSNEARSAHSIGRWFHLCDSREMITGDKFRVLAESCREYHKYHCDYSIRTNPNPNQPYRDSYGELFEGNDFCGPAKEKLVCCNEKCMKVYDRDGRRSHEGYVFHRNANELIVSIGDTGLYRCYPQCKPIEYCNDCQRSH